MKKIIIIALVLLSTFKLSIAQTNDKKEKLQAAKIAFITQELNLSPEEAQKFWPVYNAYENESQALKKARKIELMNVSVNFETMPDADISKAIDNELNYQQQDLDLKRKYIGEFKKVLPIRKVAKLLRAEHQFKIKLIKEIQNKQ